MKKREKLKKVISLNSNLNSIPKITLSLNKIAIATFNQGTGNKQKFTEEGGTYTCETAGIKCETSLNPGCETFGCPVDSGDICGMIISPNI